MARKTLIYLLKLRETQAIYRWRRTCKRENDCRTCGFKDICLDLFEAFQEIRENLEDLGG